MNTRIHKMDRCDAGRGSTDQNVVMYGNVRNRRAAARIDVNGSSAELISVHSACFEQFKMIDLYSAGSGGNAEKPDIIRGLDYDRCIPIAVEVDRTRRQHHRPADFVTARGEVDCLIYPGIDC